MGKGKVFPYAEECDTSYNKYTLLFKDKELECEFVQTYVEFFFFLLFFWCAHFSFNSRLRMREH